MPGSPSRRTYCYSLQSVVSSPVLILPTQRGTDKMSSPGYQVKIPQQYICQTVTDPSTNWARHTVTLLTETNTTKPMFAIFVWNEYNVNEI